MDHAAEDLPATTHAAETVLACSRCDGPVNESDLVDGIAVRIDGQPVCQMCIETLPSGLRVQINRVRALKGLAVTTYRVRHPAIPHGALFTFTNAGLLMLHRRALTSGTDFTTPDLPAARPSPTADIQQPGGPGPAPRRLAPLLAMGGVGVAVVGGIVALMVMSSSGGPASKPMVVHAPAPVVVVPPPQSVAVVVEPPSTPVEEPVPRAAMTWSQYLTGHTPLEALLAAERDQAFPDIRERLINEVIRERTNELTAAGQFLQQHNFAKVTKLLDQTRIPAERSEFVDLIALETSLRHNLAFQIKALAQAPVVPLPAIPPETLPTTVDAQLVPKQALPMPEIKPVTPPIEAVTPPGAVKTPPKSKPVLTVWNGPLLLKETTLIDLDSADNIPAPWPSMVGDPDVQFVKSAFLPGTSKKRLHQVVLGISAEQVVDGGIGLVLNPNYNRKGKTIRILRDDQLLQEVVIDELGWRFIPLSFPPGADTQIRLRLEDAEELSASASFWVGPLSLVRGAQPTAETAGLLPATLHTGDVSLSLPTRRAFQALLQTVAEGRGSARGWNDPKVIAFKEPKILLADFDEKARVALAIPLRERWTHLKNPVQHAIEPFNLDPLKTLTDLKVQPSKNQTFVVMIPNGNESRLSASDWEKRVSDISSQLLKPPKGRTGGIPVWVMGSLDGAHPVDPAVWSKVRIENEPWTRPWIVIDLTAAGPLAGTVGQELIADALKTLAYQFRQAQVRAQ